MTKRLLIGATTGIVVYLAITPVMAARPFATDDAGTVARGTFELETTADFWKKKAAFGLCFKHGLTERMDIGIEMGRCMLPEEDWGFDRAAVGLKFSLIPDLFSASFCGRFGDPAYEAGLITSKTIGLFTLNGNIGGLADVAAGDADFDVRAGRHILHKAPRGRRRNMRYT